MQCFINPTPSRPPMSRSLYRTLFSIILWEMADNKLIFVVFYCKLLNTINRLCAKQLTDMPEKYLFFNFFFQAHKKEDHNEVDYPCEKCSRVFTIKKIYEKHIADAHFDDSRFICDSCVKEYKTSDELAEHIESKLGHFRFHVIVVCSQ